MLASRSAADDETASRRELLHAQSEHEMLRELVAKVVEEVQHWKPAAAMPWLIRLGNILGPGDSFADVGDSSGPSRPESTIGPELVLESDDWLRPLWMDAAISGERAARVRRLSEKFKKLRTHIDQLEAENSRLQRIRAGASGTHQQGRRAKGRQTWDEHDEEEIQALCAQASALALRTAALQQERSELEMALDAKKRSCSNLERALLSRSHIPRGAPREPQAKKSLEQRPAWDALFWKDGEQQKKVLWERLLLASFC
eukprot:TRINITY_DN8915_c0_g1_i4.p1 TRINITY_DN8915_c0_g1~~TRINITY_DN8915_c0_g1_i4.p1  ORF type:complete len:258 (+),score=62.04 TRINITY_DN8915_c0_g1_i4:557-1330(+)